MPLLSVEATAVPKTKAAMKFQKAAHRTARNGVRTRVETTVATELAASCQPLENSKASVRETTISRRLKLDMEEVASNHSRSQLKVNEWRTVSQNRPICERTGRREPFRGMIGRKHA
jgi:hypothetical protein